MNDFTACDPNIEFSLADFWAKQSSRAGLLRLYVKAEDGSGQTAYATQSVWIHPQRFQPEPMPLDPKVPESAKAQKVVETKSGQILAAFADTFAQWDEKRNEWIPSTLPNSIPVSRLNLLKTPEGDVYAFWSGYSDPLSQRSPTEFARWSSDGWVLQTAHPDLEACLSFASPYRSGGFWCRTESSAIRFFDGKWLDIPWPLHADGSSCWAWNYSEGTHLVIDAKGRHWMMCSSSIYRWSEDEGWQRIGQPLPDLHKITLDQEDRLWILQFSQTGLDKHALVSYFEGDEWVPVPVPPNLLRGDQPPILSSSPDGTIFFNDYTWNRDSGRWNRLSNLGESWPSHSLVVAFDEYQRAFLFSSHGLALWDAGEIKHWPLAFFDLVKDFRSIDNVVLDQKKRLWFIGRNARGNDQYLYRISPRKWHSFGPETGLFNRNEGSVVSNLWFDRDGTPSLFISDIGLIQASSMGWTSVFSFERSTKQFLAAYKDKSGHIYLSDYFSIYLFDQSSHDKLLIASEDDPSVYHFISGTPDSKGRYWAYAYGKQKTWILNGNKVINAYLPPGLTAGDTSQLVWLGQHVFLKGNNGFYSWDDGQFIWQKTNYQDEGLPIDSQEFYGIGDHRVLAKLSDQSWVMVDMTSGTSTSFAFPFESPFISRIVETKKGLIYADEMEGLYRFDGKRWTPLLTPQDITSTLPPNGIPYFKFLGIDQFDRVWLGGKPHRLIVFELE